MKSRASASPIDGLGPLFLVAPARLTLPDAMLEILTDHVTAQCADPDRVSDADGLAGQIC